MPHHNMESHMERASISNKGRIRLLRGGSEVTTRVSARSSACYELLLLELQLTRRGACIRAELVA